MPGIGATLGASEAAYHQVRDTKLRSAVRLSWQSRPAALCDGSAAEPDLIGGFDLFTSSRDREPPADREATPDQVARLARPLVAFWSSRRSCSTASRQPSRISRSSRSLIPAPLA